MNIVFFRPAGNDVSFWLQAGRFAEAVAQDLNINLRTVIVPEGINERIAFRDLVQDTLQQNVQPDFIISLLYGGYEVAEIEEFNRFGIPFITLNTSFDDKVAKLVDQPRERYQNWLAHLAPDEFYAGYRAMEELLQSRDVSGIGIIAGSTRSMVNNHRVRGALHKAREQGIEIIPPINTDWSVAKGKEAAQTLLRRVGNIDALWTAGPDIALGAIEAFSEARIQATIGSFDWSENTIHLVQQEKLKFSYGGHFTEAGWALILLYDFFHGLDFMKELGVLIKDPLKRLDNTNVSAISRVITNQHWVDLDFQQFSKCLNNRVERYNFDLIEIGDSLH